jgi:deazaflavin-dependent oxidoreductase (nitroreductase family)
MYAVLGFLDPLIRAEWRASGIGLRNVVDLRVAGRRSGVYRRVLVTMLRDGDQWFLIHPNGDASWTRNLEAAGTADVGFRGLPPVAVAARLLEPGETRDRAIRSTGQQPFPANLVYRLARAHIRAVAAIFAIDPISA